MDDYERRIQNETAFHDARFGGGDALRQTAAKYYSVTDAARDYYRSRVLSRCAGAAVLEYGCGAESDFHLWEQAGAKVTGIDISPIAVKLAAADATARGLKTRFETMNAEKLTYPDCSFDIIVGSGIIHHLSLDKAFAEIRRVLRPGGVAVFFEPMGHNPMINLYRRLTPRMRTADEHPLLLADIALARSFFGVAEARFFVFTALLAVPMRNTPLGGFSRRWLNSIDQWLFHLVPLSRRLAWIVVLELRKSSSLEEGNGVMGTVS
jgi:SAM-dependent methyltransferase